MSRVELPTRKGRWWTPEESKRREGLNFVRHMLTLPLSRDIVKSLPHRPVVYLLYTERHGVLYVGATRSLINRWRDHHHSYFLDLVECQIAWFPASEDEIHEIERQIIETLTPPFNWTSVKGANKWTKCVRFHNIAGRRRPKRFSSWPKRS